MLMRLMCVSLKQTSVFDLPHLCFEKLWDVVNIQHGHSCLEDDTRKSGSAQCFETEKAALSGALRRAMMLPSRWLVAMVALQGERAQI